MPAPPAPHRPSPAAALAAAALVPLLAGCCPLARWLCGPDRSPWVPVLYRTPEQAVATFLEAVRREDRAVVYSSPREA